MGTVLIVHGDFHITGFYSHSFLMKVKIKQYLGRASYVTINTFTSVIPFGYHNNFLRSFYQ